MLIFLQASLVEDAFSVKHFLMALVSELLFPFRFDPLHLKEDFALVTHQDWILHFNSTMYEGDWSAAPLRSIRGRTGQIFPDPEATEFEGTELLERLPYYRKVLSRFECPLLAARFLRLRRGSRIREHTDYKLGFEDGEIRVHIPVHTNDQVDFRLNGKRLTLREGECWYVNTSLRHSVENLGEADRIHLVIDCRVNDWVRSFFPAEPVIA